MKIVVGGYIVAYPLGGMTWHHLNYILGLESLGHEVFFLEDSGEYFYPFDPATQTCTTDSTYGRAYLEDTLRTFGSKAKWCYYSQFEDQHYGITRDQLHETLRHADLMLCVSGITPIREDRPRPRRMAVIDTDPVFTQLRLSQDAPLLDYYRRFDAAATFGRLIGTPACALPTHGLRWIPTNQPVALERWPITTPTSRQFTTIGKWEHSGSRIVQFQGRSYASNKSEALLEMIDLPEQTSWTMVLGMDGMPPDVQARFRQRGWQFVNAQAASRSARSFADFIRESAGEFTVVKQIYSGLPSGWFSDRSACYLASGRPVVTQASGFDRWLPVGEGLFSYQTLDEAAAALQAIESDYSRHSRAARQIAEQHFDARKVLRQLLSDVM